MDLETPDAAGVDEALELIVGCQADPTSAIAYVGDEVDGIRAELEGLNPSWSQTLRVGRRDGRVVAAACVDHDAETGRSWIHGPWAADDEAWATYAEALVDAMISLTPDGVDDHEVSASPAHARLEALARGRGWSPSAVHIACVATSAEGWPSASSGEGVVRPATADDIECIAAMHDAEFPDTYATARALVADADRVTYVVDDGGVLAYASGEVQADGAGYLDFLAVAPQARGRGLSKTLLAIAGRELMTRAPNHDVNLTVREDNAPAVALYEGLGFRRDAELLAYRSQVRGSAVG